jgi:hypothetical protein
MRMLAAQSGRTNLTVRRSGGYPAQFRDQAAGDHRGAVLDGQADGQKQMDCNSTTSIFKILDTQHFGEVIPMDGAQTIRVGKDNKKPKILDVTNAICREIASHTTRIQSDEYFVERRDHRRRRPGADQERELRARTMALFQFWKCPHTLSFVVSPPDPTAPHHETCLPRGLLYGMWWHVSGQNFGDWYLHGWIWISKILSARSHPGRRYFGCRIGQRLPGFATDSQCLGVLVGMVELVLTAGSRCVPDLDFLTGRTKTFSSLQAPI